MPLVAVLPSSVLIQLHPGGWKLKIKFSSTVTHKYLNRNVPGTELQFSDVRDHVKQVVSTAS